MRPRHWVIIGAAAGMVVLLTAVFCSPLGDALLIDLACATNVRNCP